MSDSFEQIRRLAHQNNLPDEGGTMRYVRLVTQGPGQARPFVEAVGRYIVMSAREDRDAPISVQAIRRSIERLFSGLSVNSTSTSIEVVRAVTRLCAEQGFTWAVAQVAAQQGQCSGEVMAVLKQCEQEQTPSKYNRPGGLHAPGHSIVHPNTP